MNPRFRRVCGCRKWWPWHTAGCLWGFHFEPTHDWELEPNDDDD